MSPSLQPAAAANQISQALNAVLGTDRFPVQVDEVAKEYSKGRFPGSPITRIHGEDMDSVDGMLAGNATKSKWIIVYNSAIASEGRKRFTIAHEFGHYMLHRHQQDQFQCSKGDIEVGSGNEQSIEDEADRFASNLLMPYDDLRRQVAGQAVSFDLFSHCANRYGVSLTAAALRWTDIAEGRAVLVASCDDHLLWAKANEAAFKSGAFLATRKNTIPLPDNALAHSANCTGGSQQHSTRANVWFPREPGYVDLKEMTMVAGSYGYSLTLLTMPDAEWRRPQHEDGDPEEDTFDRFINNGQPLDRR